MIAGTFYAVNAKCPHLGLPMKKGQITVENGQPTITCNFHNSKFSLNDGACTAWYVMIHNYVNFHQPNHLICISFTTAFRCTGALGLPGTGFLGKAMSKIGGEEGPATVYKVTNNEGKLVLEL